MNRDEKVRYLGGLLTPGRAIIISRLPSCQPFFNWGLLFPIVVLDLSGSDGPTSYLHSFGVIG